MEAHVLDPDDGVYGLVPLPYKDPTASLGLLERVEDVPGQGCLVEIARAEGFEDGDHELVQVGRADVGVTRSDGEFYAFRNQCPHDGGPVCTGNVHRKLVADFRGPGERVEKDYAEEKVLPCPWHGWSFDLETGRHVGDRSIVLPAYDVVVEDGVVYVDPGR